MGLLELNKAALIDVARHFDSQPDTVKTMMQHWIAKGKVQKVTGELCNKGCCKVAPAQLIIYEWIK